MKHLSVALGVVASLSLGTGAVASTVVFSDDFNDGVITDTWSGGPAPIAVSDGGGGFYSQGETTPLTGIYADQHYQRQQRR